MPLVFLRDLLWMYRMGRDRFTVCIVAGDGWFIAGDCIFFSNKIDFCFIHRHR